MEEKWKEHLTMVLDLFKQGRIDRDEALDRIIKVKIIAKRDKEV